MPISPYLRALRARVGPTRLLLPSVSVHVFDPAGRLLLVRQREGDVWSTPGGLIEPDERPADAAVREAWEETGLVVRPERVLGVYGGPECVVRYPHGDEVQYVITAFGAAVVGGAPRPDGDETTAVRYWAEADAHGLPLAPWLRALLPLVYGGAAGSAGAVFAPATWRPPGAPNGSPSARPAAPVGTPDVEIRPGRPSECAAVLALWQAHHPPGVGDPLAPRLADVDRLVTASDGHLLVAVWEGRVMGALIAGWDGWRGHLHHLAVDPAVRRRGVARALVAAAERLLVAKGARRIAVLVERDDPAAVAFYESLRSLGYAPDTRMQRYVRTLPSGGELAL